MDRKGPPVDWVERTMIPRRPWFPRLLPLLTANALLPPGPDWAVLGDRWWSHVRFLADDRLEGRDTGSRGYDQAAEYVAEQFRAAGLAPSGSEGFFQRMEFNVVRPDEPHSSFEMLHDEVATPLRFGEEVAPFLTVGTAPEVEAEAVFSGYGLTVPELAYDDLATPSVRGRIVVLLSGGPADMPGPIKAHYQSMEERRRSLRTAGAVGMVRIANPKSIDLPWARMASSRFEARMELRDPGEDVPVGLPLTTYFNTDRAEVLFRHSGHSFSEVLSALEADRPLPRFPLNVRLRARAAVVRSTVSSKNVVGVYPGTDPKLRNEYVAVSAHLDHIGVGEPIRGDTIYSGAMDNASGVASLIEIARSMQACGARPRRSVLFLAVAGEEKGLLGSKYFAARPTVTGPIVADLNLDMFNPIFSLNYLEVQGLDESSLGDDIRAVAEPSGVQVQPDQEPEHNLFIRSDQYSFIKKGVPALAFKFSYLPGTPEETLFKAWLTERYHAPSDDLEQPVDLPAAARFNAILERLILRVADADDRPRWKPESFFNRFVR
ncbi:MAG: M28 family metallopeptidase [Thermoplasmata archaeon]